MTAGSTRPAWPRRRVPGPPRGAAAVRRRRRRGGGLVRRCRSRSGRCRTRPRLLAVPYPTRTLPESGALRRRGTGGRRRPPDPAPTVISGCAHRAAPCPPRRAGAAPCPAYGHGTSTTALAVSTSTTIWSTVDGVADRDLPLDDLRLGQPLAEVGQPEHLLAASRWSCDRSPHQVPGVGLVVALQPVDGVEDPVDAGQVVRAPASAAGTGCRTRPPAAPAPARRWKQRSCTRAAISAPDPGEARGLLHDHAAPGPADRGRDRLVVEGHQRPQVHDLQVPALLRARPRRPPGRPAPTARTRRAWRRGPPRRIAARPNGARPRCARSVSSLRPVQLLRLQEDHRVGVGDGVAQQPVRVLGRGRGDDLQARGVRVVRLAGVAVVLDAADAAARRGSGSTIGSAERARGCGCAAWRRARRSARTPGRRRRRTASPRPGRNPPIAMPTASADDARLGERGVEAALARRTRRSARR